MKKSVFGTTYKKAAADREAPIKLDINARDIYEKIFLPLECFWENLFLKRDNMFILAVS
ncbi:hypothetical protein CLOSBL3_10255 [Clostridiaceae bacterium BL-3]|nr:hypothetical protein CLOSBL3_10255 [Clostridiaceae bacterium BL-3]